MKKINVGYCLQWQWPKLFLIMKLVWIFILSGMLAANAKTFSQNVRLDLKTENASLKSVLSKIEEKTDYYFFYKNEEIENLTNITIDAKQELLSELLSNILKNKGFEYEVHDHYILIQKANSNTSFLDLMQQQKSVTGKVTDSAGSLLPGVTVIIKGTTKGIITDTNGTYTLSSVPENSILQFSFVGMKTQEIKVGSKTLINVTMEEETVGIEEVVAIGYGTVKKSDLTGSVAKIKTEGTETAPNSSMEQLLQGKSAGVQIVQNTGAPGEGMTFLVRGANSMSGNNQPLVVLDGYPLETGNASTSIGSDGVAFLGDSPAGNALAGINPNDIESVEILKDASATAIYGSRGANGVVLITTKRGKKGKERIEYNFRTDISMLRKQIDVLNAEQFMTYMNEAYVNSGRAIPYSPSSFGTYRDNNWQDQIFQTSFSQDHQLTISGGKDDMKYAIIAGYTDMEGIVKYTSSFKRASARINLDRNIGNRLKIGTNITGSMTYNQSVIQSPTNASNVNGSAILATIFGRPIDTAYNEDGSINEFVGNPVTIAKLTTNETNSRGVILNAFGDLSLTKDLKFRVNGGTNFSQSIRDAYFPRGTYSGNQRSGAAFYGDALTQNFLWENTLNFNKEIKKHRVNAVAGYTYQNWQARSFGISVGNFANDHLSFYNLANANIIDKPKTSYQEYALSSYLGRVNYTFDNRYMFTFTVRSDGSTRLADGYKWALFPSVALGWNVHNETFMKNTKAISELKLRGSYGVSGNQSVAVGQTQSYYTAIQSMVNGSAVTGYTQGGLANNMLGWETTSQLDLGFNLGLLSNRFTLGFDYYKKSTTDLLINTPLPLSTGYTGLTKNSGEIQNRGYEFEFGAVILKGKLKWNTSGNLSINRNKVISLGDFASIAGPSFNLYGIVNTNWHIAMPGQPIGAFYGYKLDGIYQTQEEIDNGPIETVTGVQPGLWRFKDVSGPNGTPDGKIDANDRTIIGNPNPDFTFGLNNTLSYKNFGLSFFIMGCVGNDLLNLNNFVLTSMDASMSPSNLTVEAYNNRWTGPGTSNFYAKPTYAGGVFYKRATDAMVEDGTFYRLKNVTLSYEIPVKKLKLLKSLKVFATGSNLITITNYSGFDPEISSRGMNAMSPGVDLGAIPQVRCYSFGLNLNF